MVLKFLPNKKGGGIGSIYYLLDKKRVENGTAKTLRGDPNITKSLINSLTKKQKVTFGVLSFEEADIPEHQKQELMDRFEQTFFAGLNKEQYNILWVQHTDKGRLELNFVIPKIELSTGKSYNPYYHKTDFHLADLFQKEANLKYGFTDPKDPAKQQTLQGSKKEINLIKDYQKLDEQLNKYVADGLLKNRDEIIDQLKKVGIEVGRVGKDYITVKLPDSKRAKRLKGGIYGEQFTSIRKLSEISQEKDQREREFARRNTEEELRGVTERLKTAIQKRAKFNEEKYREHRKRTDATEGNEQENSRESYKAERESYQNSGASKEAREVQEKAREPKPMAEDKGSINDRTRRTIAERVRERESVLKRAGERAREPRTSLYEQFKEDRTSLFEQTRTVVRDRANRRDRRAKRIKSYTGLARTVNSLAKATNSTAKTVYEARRAREAEQRELEREIERTRNDLEREVLSKYDALEREIGKLDEQAQQLIEEREEPEQGLGMGW